MVIMAALQGCSSSVFVLFFCNFLHRVLTLDGNLVHSRIFGSTFCRLIDSDLSTTKHYLAFEPTENPTAKTRDMTRNESDSENLLAPYMSNTLT